MNTKPQPFDILNESSAISDIRTSLLFHTALRGTASYISLVVGCHARRELQWQGLNWLINIDTELTPDVDIKPYLTLSSSGENSQLSTEGGTPDSYWYTFLSTTFLKYP